MTYQTDVKRGRETIERWCLLAEQRLDYLTELYETGRWRRFHSEVAFLDNIQEAKTAVETWRLLLTQEGLPDNSAVENSWLERRKPLPPRHARVLRDDVRQPLPRSLQIVIDGARSETPEAAAPEPAELVPVALDERGWERTPDLAAMQERYPLLRTAL